MLIKSMANRRQSPSVETRLVPQGRPDLDDSHRRFQSPPDARADDGDRRTRVLQPDGRTIWYDLQTPKSKEVWLAGVAIASGERIRYRLAREQRSVHFNASPDGKLFAGVHEARLSRRHSAFALSWTRLTTG